MFGSRKRTKIHWMCQRVSAMLKRKEREWRNWFLSEMESGMLWEIDLCLKLDWKKRKNFDLKRLKLIPTCSEWY